MIDSRKMLNSGTYYEKRLSHFYDPTPIKSFFRWKESAAVFTEKLHLFL